MSTIWTADLDDCKGRVLAFPSDPLAPPPAMSLREIARLLVSEWRRKRAKSRALRELGAVSAIDDPLQGDLSDFAAFQRMPVRSIERAISVASDAPSTPRNGKRSQGCEPFRSDAAGSPSESWCAPSHLRAISAARDEWEARQLRDEAAARRLLKGTQ